jgi:hypothetical protein
LNFFTATASPVSLFRHRRTVPYAPLAHDANHLVLVHRVLGRELSGQNDGVRYRYVEPYERTRDVPELRPPVRDARVSDPSETGCERVLKGGPQCSNARLG